MRNILIALLGSSLIMPCILITLFSLVSCEKRNDVDHLNTVDEEEIKRLIADLESGANPNDPDSVAFYNKTIKDLTGHGSGSEAFLVFELNQGRHWAVRYGCIEVLDSVGSKQCVEALIGRLTDEHPKVALKAMYSLRVFCEHRIVPETLVEGQVLPPLPKRRSDQGIEGDYRNWIDWYDAHGLTLHKQWSLWWKENQASVKIE